MSTVSPGSAIRVGALVVGVWNWHRVSLSMETHCNFLGDTREADIGEKYQVVDMAEHCRKMDNEGVVEYAVDAAAGVAEKVSEEVAGETGRRTGTRVIEVVEVAEVVETWRQVSFLVKTSSLESCTYHLGCLEADCPQVQPLLLPSL